MKLPHKSNDFKTSMWALSLEIRKTYINKSYIRNSSMRHSAGKKINESNSAFTTSDTILMKRIFAVKSLQMGRCVNKKCVILEFGLGDTRFSDLRIIIFNVFMFIWEYRNSKNYGFMS